MYNVTSDDSTVLTATVIWKFTAIISTLHKEDRWFDDAHANEKISSNCAN